MMKKILDLGCGKSKKKGAIGFDHIKTDCVDIVGDLNKPLPFADNEFDYIYMDNVLEHLNSVHDILKEVHRITKSTGYIIISVPFYNAPTSADDPTHKHQFSYKTFDYFTESFEYHYYFDFSFKIIKKIIHPTRIGSLFPEKITLKLAAYFGNLITALTVVLQPIKK
jgi:predicted SAM-dependent methyltransferase